MSTAAVATTEPVPQPTTVAICEHIKDNGRRCGTPAIRGRHFCYYHSRAHSPARLGSRGYRAHLPETIESLQLTIMQITEALGSGRITEKAAGKLLFGVQLSTNLLKMKIAQKEDGEVAPSTPSVGSTEAVDEPVTELPAAMEEALAAPPEPDPESAGPAPRCVADDDPEMPVTVKEAERALLAPQQVIDHYNTLRECDRLSPRYAKILRRLELHHRAYRILSDQGIIGDDYLNEFSNCQA